MNEVFSLVVVAVGMRILHVFWLKKGVSRRHVGVAVDKIDIRVAMVKIRNLASDRHHSGLVDESEPDSGEDVEDVPEGEQRFVAKHLVAEFVSSHEDDSGEDGEQEASFLMRNAGECQDGDDCHEHGEGIDRSEAGLLGPGEVAEIQGPADECDDEDGSEGAKEDGEVD